LRSIHAMPWCKEVLTVFGPSKNGCEFGSVMNNHIQFRNIVFSVNGCPALDESEPVFAEITSRGDMVIHNYDRSAVQAVLALGLNPEHVPCVALQQTWRMVIDQNRLELINRLPIPLQEEAQRIFSKINVAANKSLDKSNYDEFFHECRENTKQVEHFVKVTGLNPTGLEQIIGHVASFVMQTPGRRDRHYPVLKIYMSITIQGYMDVLNMIQDGLISDQRNKQMVVVGIDDVLNNDRMIVRVGHQGRDMSVSTRSAIISRRGPLKKLNWKLETWL
jgi:hypothetical protein